MIEALLVVHLLSEDDFYARTWPMPSVEICEQHLERAVIAGMGNRAGAVMYCVPRPTGPVPTWHTWDDYLDD